MVTLYVSSQIFCASTICQFTVAQSTNGFFALYNTTRTLIESKYCHTGLFPLSFFMSVTLLWDAILNSIKVYTNTHTHINGINTSMHQLLSININARIVVRCIAMHRLIAVSFHLYARPSILTPHLVVASGTAAMSTPVGTAHTTPMPQKSGTKPCSVLNILPPVSTVTPQLQEGDTLGATNRKLINDHSIILVIRIWMIN